MSIDAQIKEALDDITFHQSAFKGVADELQMRQDEIDGLKRLVEVRSEHHRETVEELNEMLTRANLTIMRLEGKEKKKAEKAMPSHITICKVLTLSTGLLRSISTNKQWENTLVKPLLGLRDFVSSHKTEINQFIDDNYDQFKDANDV